MDTTWTHGIRTLWDMEPGDEDTTEHGQHTDTWGMDSTWTPRDLEPSHMDGHQWDPHSAR